MEKITLEELYGDIEDFPSNEVLLSFIDEEDWYEPFDIQILEPKDFKKLETHHNFDKVVETFKNASQFNLDIVDQYGESDEAHIIVIGGKTLLDGYHRLYAHYLKDEPIYFIDVYS